MTDAGAPQRIRLVGACRRTGNVKNPRCSNLRSKVRAAMSLRAPAALRHPQRVATSRDSRHRLQCGWAPTHCRRSSRSTGLTGRP